MAIAVRLSDLFASSPSSVEVPARRTRGVHEALPVDDGRHVLHQLQPLGGGGGCGWRWLRLVVFVARIPRWNLGFLRLLSAWIRRGVELKAHRRSADTLTRTAISAVDTLISPSAGFKGLEPEWTR